MGNIMSAETEFDTIFSRQSRFAFSCFLFSILLLINQKTRWKAAGIHARHERLQVVEPAGGDPFPARQGKSFIYLHKANKINPNNQNNQKNKKGRRIGVGVFDVRCVAAPSAFANRAGHFAIGATGAAALHSLRRT